MVPGKAARSSPTNQPTHSIFRRQPINALFTRSFMPDASKIKPNGQQLKSVDYSVTENPASKLARNAFWLMVRRVIVVAAVIDFAFFVLFLIFDSFVLAWMNVVSISLYIAAYWLVSRRHNMLALTLIWVEVLGHAAIGTMLVGWDSGFHYYLLMFIPAIVVSTRLSTVVSLLLVLIAFYLGLHTASRLIGIVAPLSDIGLWVVHGFNVVVVFMMASYTARFYYNSVRKAENKLLQLATQDSLTGLSNRRNLLERARQEIVRARRRNEPIALIIADIDHFKAINDRYGHEAGDNVIRHAAELLQRLCRQQDVVARWGGEEFLLLLPSTNLPAAEALAERFRQAVVESVVAYGELEIKLMMSFGVAVLEHNENIDDAIARADKAMYQSKNDGRNRVTVAA